MMPKRKKTPRKVEAELLTRCRHRCALCFGLDRDESIKQGQGQIAHLDHDSSNCNLDNLVYLCLKHHSSYDSVTSQSKNFTLLEVKQYREELESRFRTWKLGANPNQFLSFLADQVDIKTMADAAEKAAGMYVWYARQLALEALTRVEMEYCDMDLWVPLLATLDHFQSWGWLTYTVDEREDEDGTEVMHIRVDHQAVCADVAKLISGRDPDSLGRS